MSGKRCFKRAAYPIHKSDESREGVVSVGYLPLERRDSMNSQEKQRLLRRRKNVEEKIITCHLSLDL